MTAADRRRDVIVAGHRGDTSTARDGLTDPDPGVRAVALSALARLDALDAVALAAAIGDPDPGVRARVAELGAVRDDVDLAVLLEDPDPDVVEVAAWAHGERATVADAALERLIQLATTADEPLVRESAVAALGAIGDERGLPAILAATSDKPAVRRRAVLALAPFGGDEVDAALTRALEDRDWQVRQAAQDLVEAAGESDDGED